MLSSLSLSLSCLLSLSLSLVLSTLLAPCPDTAQSSRLRLDVAESGVWSFHGSLGSDWDVDYIAKGYARTQGARFAAPHSTHIPWRALRGGSACHIAEVWAACAGGEAPQVQVGRS